MFGHDNDDQNQNDQSAQTVEPVADGHLGDSAGGASVISEPAGPPPTTDDPMDPSRAMPPPGFNPYPNKDNQDQVQPAPSPPDTTPVLPEPAGGPPADDSLLDIKKQALQQLGPLVGQLDQTPEEKFKTTMMMIQATDNQTLINTAYEAALSIPDEKARAQALLDVVNEINYFVQQQK